MAGWVVASGSVMVGWVVASGSVMAGWVVDLKVAGANGEAIASTGEHD